MRLATLSLPLMLLLLLGTGCVKYQYDIVRPESSRSRIGEDDWQRVAAGPVAYRFKTVDNHLVAHIYNETRDPLKILGDRSYVVTPANQSIPLTGQTIAPGSYAKVILPPVRQVIRRGPSMGIGFGYSTGRMYHGHPAPLYNPMWSDPAYLVVGDAATYWEWEGQTDATLHLVFEPPAGKTFEQEFVFHRVKV